MSGTESSGGQSSQGFLHWLKNTWQKFWNWITSCFRSEQEETEPKLISHRKIRDEQNGQFQSLEVGQDKASEPGQSGEEIRGDVQKEGRDLSQIPVNPESPTMSRSSSEASINRQLEFDDHLDTTTLSGVKTQGTSSQPEQKSDSSDIEEEKGSRERKSGSKIKGRDSKTEDKEKHRKQVLKNKEAINKKSEEKVEETLENSNKKLDEAAGRREKNIEKIREKARNTQERSRSGNRSEHNGNSPNPNLSRSNSSLSSSNSQKY